ncbi:MAG: SIS domain-containing protein [Planctomycetes bacterium]|nr:SIS domain-containing protein [Planctomycetota bacterium]
MDFQKRFREIVEAEADAIRRIPINGEFERAVSAIHDCSGKVLTTGIGKAGHIAAKFAATLCSTGTPAAFVHPAEAAHGDLGLVSEDDVIVALSTSGKTREVLEMLELGRHLGLSTIIGITSHPDSALRELSDVVIDMGIIEEPCPLGLTPSASIAVFLAITDAIALTLLELRGFTAHDYGLRHHGGYLGRKARLDNE